MIAGVNTTSFVITGVLVAILVAGRVLIQRYGHSIGVDAPDFDYRSEIRRERSVYTLLRAIYMIGSFAVGVWIMVLGMLLVLGAVQELPAARQSGLPLGPLRWAGALGGVLEFAGVGVIAVALTLGWGRPPQETKPASGAARPIPPASADTIPAPSASLGPTSAEFAAFAQVVGPRSEKRPISRGYNIRPWIVWGMIVFALLLLICYLMLFVIELPPEMIP